MKRLPCRLPGLLLLEAPRYTDDRGYFTPLWMAEAFQEEGIPNQFVQDNLSFSRAGVLRGLHYQIQQPQGKLIRVLTGGVFDVAVDLRRSSPTFGQWEGHALSADPPRLFWIPPGFAHGFLVTGGDTLLMYKCTAGYLPAAERCIRWDDPDLAIAWPLANPPILSAKDQSGQTFAEAETWP